MDEGLKVQELIALGQLLLSFGVIVYTYLTTRSRATRDEMKGLAEILDRHAERLTRLEADHRHMPDAKEFAKLSADIQTLEGTINKVAAELGGMRDISKILHRQVETMDDYLRKAGK